jgi:hypothetical protein
MEQKIIDTNFLVGRTDRPRTPSNSEAFLTARPAGATNPQYVYLKHELLTIELR